ncbi:hypothetical protein D3C84_343700 [compost metagenome]
MSLDELSSSNARVDRVVDLCRSELDVPKIDLGLFHWQFQIGCAEVSIEMSRSMRVYTSIRGFKANSFSSSVKAFGEIRDFQRRTIVFVLEVHEIVWV